jgi:hypothetical protein
MAARRRPVKWRGARYLLRGASKSTLTLTIVIDLLQWPAMAATLIAAWLVASQSKRRRGLGFWCFIAGNVLWVAWGMHSRAYALVALQFGLFFLNLRGARKNDPKEAGSGSH